jgi:penicillin-binding protein 2
MIYDREGRPLVRNVPVYRIEEAGKSEVEEKEYRVISREEALRLKAEGGELVERLKVGVGRDYLYGSSLSHVLGYLSWELKGASGVEKQYNQILQGQDGGEIIEVDTRGVKVREIDRLEPVPGRDLALTIDAELAKKAAEILADQPGAIVASEAKTGRILVLASSPSFNPSLFHPGGGLGLTPKDGGEIREVEIEKIFNDPAKPMFNRAISGAYPPGSTFKIVSAAAGLEEGKITGETLINDPGVITVGPYSYSNWLFSKTGRTEGEINVVRAIKRSTDTYFYKVGERVGAESLAAWAGAFGLGKLTGIDLGGEVVGLVPSPDWKKEVMGERWFLGNTYHFAIGQADLLSTPLQVNMMMSVIANDGKLCQPTIRGKHLPGEANTQVSLLEGESESCLDLQLEQATLQLIKEGLKEACSPGGTAGVFFNYEPQVACKTGTAEYGERDEKGFRKTHAWLTAFAPADDPEIVVTALVEGGGEGSTVAAPLVKQLMEAWFGEEE